MTKQNDIRRETVNYKTYKPYQLIFSVALYDLDVQHQRKQTKSPDTLIYFCTVEMLKYTGLFMYTDLFWYKQNPQIH